MEANRLKFWMISRGDQWSYSTDSDVETTEHGSLRLASRQARRPNSSNGGTTTPLSMREDADSRLGLVPGTRDAHGTWATFDPEAKTVNAAGALPGSISIAKFSEGTVTDLAMGWDDILYIAVDAGIVMADRRDRWNPASVAAIGFDVWRIASAPCGGVWALDKTARKIARLTGLPLPRLTKETSPATFRPEIANPDPPRLDLWSSPDWQEGEQVVAIACSPAGRLAVMTWAASGEANVHCLQDDGAWSKPTTLAGAQVPYSFSWIEEDRVAALCVNLANEAPVFDLQPGTSVSQTGDFYPLQNHNGEPFLAGLDLKPHYLTSDRQLTALNRLSLPSYANEGSADGWAYIRAAKQTDVAEVRWPLDSEQPGTIWHRLYLEAYIPVQCGVVIELAATDSPIAPESQEEWHPHRFGDAEMVKPSNGTPCGAWINMDSELPFQSGLTGCPIERNRRGLFTALIQRSNRPVRRLRGRFLHVRAKLTGNKRTTPEIFAVRAYGSRFSYVDNYLPDVYRESKFGTDADQLIESTEHSTAADFLDRFLSNFESILTPLEDRIAASYLLTDPRTVPDESLEWLASWTGLTFDPLYPEDRRRALLRKAPELARRRGTLPGLQLALDIVTDGSVRGGEIVVLEDFRLRRTFSTILGANLKNADSQLLAGITASGNSYVGETLFLGDENELESEFFGLFGTDVPDDAQEQEILEFFDRLAHRVTVLVHNDLEPQDIGLIERVVENEIPAHVKYRVLTASAKFLVGVTALLGIESYPRPKPPQQPVRIGVSQVGVNDRLLRAGSLDPRLKLGGLTTSPVAKASSPVIAEVGTPFVLDASGSYTIFGNKVERYIWKLL